MSSKDLKPKLRFPQFKVAWTKTKLGEVTTKVEKRNRGKEILPVYSISNKYGFIHQSEQFEGMDSIERGFDTTQYKIVDNNTFAYNPARINVGSIGYNENLGVVLLSSLYVCFKTKDFIDDNFFWQFLNTNQFANEVSSKGEGGVRIYLFYENFATIKFVYPQIEEQQKIASFINSIDKKLNALIEKQSLLQEYKKGVMQKIFDRSIRFKDDEGNDFPEWEEKKLGEISTITTGSSNREDSILNGEFTFFDRSKDIRTSKRYLFDKEAIIVPGEGQQFIPKYFIGKFDLHQRTYAIFNFINTNGKFLYYHLCHLDKHLQSQAVGSTVKSLRLPMFITMPIFLPSLSEQVQIAHFLTLIDSKIETIESQIESIINYKKALMQQMFC